MTDIVEFLRARYAEDEAIALGATPGPWEFEGDDPTDDEVYSVHDGKHGDLIGDIVAYARGRDRQQSNMVHIARHNPDRALADTDAKLRLLEQFELRGNSVRATVVPATGGVWDDLLRLLALPFAGHADYDRRWRPADV